MFNWEGPIIYHYRVIMVKCESYNIDNEELCSIIIVYKVSKYTYLPEVFNGVVLHLRTASAENAP